MERLFFQTVIISSTVESRPRKQLGMAANSEKKGPWWNKEAIQAKKDAFKALLQNRLSPD